MLQPGTLGKGNPKKGLFAPQSQIILGGALCVRGRCSVWFKKNSNIQLQLLGTRLLLSNENSGRIQPLPHGVQSLEGRQTWVRWSTGQGD